jgi:arginyl-tRNA synthetase
MLHNKFETIIEYIKDELKSAILKQTDFISTYHLDVKNLKVEVDKTKNIKFADYSSNIVMLFGLDMKRAEEFAQLIIGSMKSSYFEKIEFVKPGFINFIVKHDTNFDVINKILEEKDDFGKFKDTKLFYNIEFVSANPTGLLHIGHARNAAIGDTLARI